ncbi:hypothetical protein SLEP1_g52647 [Rubroshorea leprosula]|uniref:Uncharacterized protein n=1 Tax=Rubroshorea leprosula TaxID=152421 RepID=A0AAV5M6Y1_9ROSI|nr:hypothetical protein SLEP1_g52647 [Rubroshorea leprosula]
MKAHLATLPLPPKISDDDGDDDSASPLLSSSMEKQEQEQEQRVVKQKQGSSRRESFGQESEIELRNPTGKRSRRNQKPITSEGGNQNLERE